MQISQSRANNRGPLIAVIKIEIEEGQIDRIFLHQNDDDYKLAQQFQHKHNLGLQFVQHIYQRIKISRESLQKQSQVSRSAIANNNSNTQRSNNLQNQSNYIATPVQDYREADRYNYRNTTKQMQRNYQNYLEDMSTPYDRVTKVTKFTPIPQDYHQQQHIPINLPKQSKFVQPKYTNAHQFHIEQNTNENSYKNKQTFDHSTFETFMQNTKNQNNHDFFQKYLRERRAQSNEQNAQPKRLIQKTNIAIPTQSYYQSKQKNQSSKQSKTYLNQVIPINQNTINNNKKTRTESHYTFNQDKPSQVKILRKQQIQSMNSSMSRQKSLSKLDRQQIAKQVTTRLYNQTDIKKNYLNKIKQRAKQDKQIQEDKQLTYRPQINKVSQIIAADRYKNGQVQDYLIQKAKKAQLKRETERALKAQKQMENCSFKPTVNEISKKLTKDTSRSLLKESNSNKKNQSCNKKHSHSQAVFKPSLNNMSQKIVKTKYEGNFQQRLKGYLQQKNNKLNQLTKQKLKKQKVDEKGQQLFRPRIYSKPVNRSPKGAEIHDYLYQMSKVNKTLPTQQHKPIINENSQQIIQQMYMKRIAWLFSQLDSDQDGFISPKRTCISTINSQILQIIAPILFQMEELSVQLNLAEFRNAIKNLHPSLNAHQKSILYSYANKSQQNDNKGLR